MEQLLIVGATSLVTALLCIAFVMAWRSFRPDPIDLYAAKPDHDADEFQAAMARAKDRMERMGE